MVVYCLNEWWQVVYKARLGGLIVQCFLCDVMRISRHAYRQERVVFEWV